MEFQADADVGEIAMAYAADMVDFARDRYKIDLDFTLASVDGVDKIAADLVARKPRFARFIPGFGSKVESFSKGLGFYVSETIRKSLGAEHGWVTDGEARIYGLRLSDGTVCWPVGRAQQLLTKGPDNDFRSYVAALQATTSHDIAER